MFRDLSIALITAALAQAVGVVAAPQQPATNQPPTNQSPASQPPAHQPPANQPPTNQSPTNQSPTNASPTSAQPQDPAAVVFSTSAGMVLHAVKKDSAAHYEQAIVALKDALAKATDPETQQLARGWRIYRATEPDAKSSVIYVHMLDPVVPNADYRPSLWLDKLLAGAPLDLLTKYRDAFALPPTKLSLTELPAAKPPQD